MISLWLFVFCYLSVFNVCAGLHEEGGVLEGDRASQDMTGQDQIELLENR